MDSQPLVPLFSSTHIIASYTYEARSRSARSGRGEWTSREMIKLEGCVQTQGHLLAQGIERIVNTCS